ncbi:FAD-binding oxidoreductase [Mycobacterium aquaticum]|uniref:FAD-linked oxidoreductase n=1 Tax=Mycobacterium aquaticum TaxID=1927124 RepID=A0A1X0AMC2_9MYCO|nr:FAD-binding oxidoreductase [Mycobacterium aquaticum]ORA31213.1 FAD-linked oxidoreductase [Mycobacterium aquaticum]
MTPEISRQDFLRGALGLATVTALGACRDGSPSAPAGSATAGPTTTAGPPDWSGLADSLDGHVILPADPEFGSAKGIFNTRFAESTPAAVVAVGSASDVSKAVAFAAAHAVKVAPRSGGHSYVGASATSGAMVVDLRGLPRTVDYDDSSGLVTVAAAVDLDTVQSTLNEHSRSIPTGSCPSVGVAGLTLGGGLGADARQYGLTCDSLVSATVVVPGGDTVTASSGEHDDLLWALRGGGGGCGVVTSFTFRTFATVDRDVVTLVFPESAAAQVIHGWHAWLGTAQREIWGMLNLTSGPGPELQCTIVLAAPARTGGQAASALAASIDTAPLSTRTQTLGHLDFVHYFEGGSDATRPRAFVAGSDLIAEMTSAAADSIVAAMSAWPKDAGAATAVIESLDGAITDTAPDATAFPWRGQAACVQWYTEPPSPPAIESATGWLRDAHQAVQANSVGGYVNYVEAGMPAARYFERNLDRLNTVRSHYDPSGLIYSALGAQ